MSTCESLQLAAGKLAARELESDVSRTLEALRDRAYILALLIDLRRAVIGNVVQGVHTDPSAARVQIANKRGDVVLLIDEHVRSGRRGRR